MPPVFVFRFLGREQKSNILELRRKSVPVETVIRNECYSLSLRMRPVGKVRRKLSRNSHKKVLALHYFSAGIDSVL